jgi:hypothetical protein
MGESMGVVWFFLGVAAGVFIMSLFSANAYEKGYKDGKANGDT